MSIEKGDKDKVVSSSRWEGMLNSDYWLLNSKPSATMPCPKGVNSGTGFPEKSAIFPGEGWGLTRTIRQTKTLKSLGVTGPTRDARKNKRFIG